MRIRKADVRQLDSVVEMHMATFPGFFLTFLGPGFLKCLYKAFLMHDTSDLLIAENADGVLLGFSAYSNDLKALYNHLLRHSMIPLAWYSLVASLRRPSAIFRLLRGLKQPIQAVRAEQYAELASIGVAPKQRHSGIGSALINDVKSRINFSAVSYLKLETDADNNDEVNAFYLHHSFELHHSFLTPEGRRMNEYRYIPPSAKLDKR